MAIGDPFSTTYEGAYKSGISLGAGIDSAAGDIGGAIAKKQNLQKTSDMLKQFGIITESDTPPSTEELKADLQQKAKDFGVNNLSFMESDDPEETRKSLESAYKVYGLPMPTPKKSITFDSKRASELGMDLDATTGDLKFNPSKNLLAQLGLMGMTPEKIAAQGMEVTGYDQKGQPMIRKVNRNIPAEKFDTEQQDKQKAQAEKSQLILDSANDTLNTIGEVEKGINNFGVLGGLPSIPGTERVNWEANVNKLLSGKIIDVMTKMKEASKTGATGFGQLSNKELEILRNASTALKRGMKPEEAQKYLDQMRESMTKIVENKSTENTGSTTSNEDPLGLR